MFDLTAFQRDIIRILGRDGELIGLEIKRTLEDEYDTDVNHGRLYPNLDQLVEEGYIDKGEKDGRTNNYTLSPKGQNLSQGMYVAWDKAV